MKRILTWQGKAKDLMPWLRSMPLTLTMAQYNAMLAHGSKRA